MLKNYLNVFHMISISLKIILYFFFCVCHVYCTFSEKRIFLRVTYAISYLNITFTFCYSPESIKGKHVLVTGASSGIVVWVPNAIFGLKCAKFGA